MSTPPTPTPASSRARPPVPAAAAPATRWRMPLLVRASLAVHAAALIALLVVPAGWPWVVAALVLDHAVLSFTGLWPRSTWLGPNVRRLPAAAAARGAVALTIDDGPDPDVTPAVLDLLQARGARATFFCIAEHAARHPALAREIVARGHSVQNHSDVHRHDFSVLGPRAMAADVARAQARLAAAAGEAATCFRAPAGLRNPFLDPVLHRQGLRLVSWTRRGFDTRERDPARVLARLVRHLAAGDILLLHDGHAARGASGRPVVLDVLPALLDAIAAAGLHTETLPQALAATSPTTSHDALAPT